MAIVGAGPIGPAAILTSPFYSPSEIFMIDLDDTAIEAVGIPATFNLCEHIVAPGGTIANIGVHGSRSISISSGSGRET